MPLNFGAREDSWESLGQQGDQASHLKEISTEYSLERQILKLKLLYFGHLMRRVNLKKQNKNPDAGKDSGRRTGDDRG